MTAERVSPQRWRRRRPAEEDLLRAETETFEAPEARPVALHRAPSTSRNPTAGGSWAGRVSEHRRAQVRARGPEPVVDGPTGPVDSRRGQPAAPAEAAPARQVAAAPAVVVSRIAEAWVPVVDRLELEIDNLLSVLLCTPDGVPLAAHGIDDADVPAVASLTGAVFSAGGMLTAARHDDSDGAATIQLTSGQTNTVVATVTLPDGSSHALSVSAEGVSLGVLLVQARLASDSLRMAIEGKVA